MGRPAKKIPKTKMTTLAKAAFEIYRDLGPTRTLAQAAELMGKSYSQLNTWSHTYGWTKLCTDHDYSKLRDSLGRRELQKEGALQVMIDRCNEAADVLYEIMTDTRSQPILNRQGEPLIDPNTGEAMVKPLVKASTRAMCAEKILGIGGLVPVKRTEMVDRTSEGLDAAAAVLQSMSPSQLEQLQKILDNDG